MSARDTQFAGFAKLLYSELMNSTPTYQDGHVVRGTMSRDEVEQIIAQRAYDLTQHAVGYALEYLHECGIKLSSGMDKRILLSIPDLNDWAKWGYKVQEK